MQSARQVYPEIETLPVHYLANETESGNSGAI